MSLNSALSKFKCCYICLCNDKERILQQYLLRTEQIKALFQEDHILLCYICKRLAQHVELFIFNAQKNKALLESCFKKKTSTFEDVKIEVQTSIALSNQTLLPVMVPGDGMEQLKMEISEEVNIKVESPEDDIEDCEKSDTTENFNDGYLINDIINGNNTDAEYHEVNIKEEDNFPLNELLKVEYESIHKKNLKEVESRKKVKEKVKKIKVKKENLIDNDVSIMAYVKRVQLSRKQYMEERERMANDKNYVKSTYKCTDCLKGFGFKPSYDAHMELHKESSGPHRCDMCKQRFQTEEKMLSHKKYTHTIRYRCKLCGHTRKNCSTIRDHYTATHCNDSFKVQCPHCSKNFARSSSLRRHIICTHTKKIRVLCPYCNKNYSSKEGLKNHMNMIHPEKVCAVEKEKKYACKECNKAFMAPSRLKLHMIKHTDSKTAYCVECDKSFKSEYTLQQHYKNAAPHTNSTEKPLKCDHCDKRFSVRRDIELHMNRIHLNKRPHVCDLCDRAYSAPWSLTQHKRLRHEGYKRPMKFPCEMCDKVFDRIQILRSHVRTHTGERPFQCPDCPATFAQNSTLRTHKKLIHLKLTRDGKPKHGAKLTN